jgi:hypothetical protein
MNIFQKQYLLFNNELNNIYHDKVMVYCQCQDEIINYQTDYDNIIWHYNDQNYRIPYINNIKINAIKLSDGDNPYDYISSCKILDDNEIISGERIQKLADIVLGVESSLAWNPNNIYYSNKLGNINHINDISMYNIIFVFTHDLELFYDKFKDQIENKTIISHNSDHEITYIKNVKMHLAQNCLIKNPKLISIPIGIQNLQWFDHNIFFSVKNMNVKKTKNIYFNFNLSTHHSRQTCYDILKDKLQWNDFKNKKDFYIELKSHKYAICPRGNGIDTHRLWECIYLDVIPIVIKEDFPNIDNLPIIILENWNEINKINAFSNQKLSKITQNYYRNILSSLK